MLICHAILDLLYTGDGRQPTGLFNLVGDASQCTGWKHSRGCRKLGARILYEPSGQSGFTQWDLINSAMAWCKLQLWWAKCVTRPVWSQIVSALQYHLLCNYVFWQQLPSRQLCWPPRLEILKTTIDYCVHKNKNDKNFPYGIFDNCFKISQLSFTVVSMTWI